MNWNPKTMNRRRFLTVAGGALAAPAILHHTRAYAQNPTIKVGYVSPKTGPLAGFAEADDYIIAGIKEKFAAGVANNGKNWKEWRLWLSQHELTTTEDGRVLPIIPTWGNHDSGILYFEVFDLDKPT